MTFDSSNLSNPSNLSNSSRLDPSSPESGAPRKGLLLLNLGTPDRPEPEAVGRYLKQFLMDKWVIDIPWPLRWFLVNVMIVPKRKYASAAAYEKIWSAADGSPLLHHLRELEKAVAPKLADEFETAIAMRYGNPSITSGLECLRSKGVGEILVLPLYPQYAESSTRSSEDECRAQAARMGLRARLEFVPAFYDHPEFIESFRVQIAPVLEREEPDHLLMSFHGLPERHIKRTDRSGTDHSDTDRSGSDRSGGVHCLVKPGCCDVITAANRDCYRAQCFATARALAAALGLARDRYTVSFQSRLGRTPWIKPYTDEVYGKLAARGVRKLAVVCPSFTADCLETLEEVRIRGEEDFRAAGGESLHAIPCLNSHSRWVEAVVRLVRAKSLTVSPRLRPKRR